MDGNANSAEPHIDVGKTQERIALCVEESAVERYLQISDKKLAGSGNDKDRGLRGFYCNKGGNKSVGVADDGERAGNRRNRLVGKNNSTVSRAERQ